MIQFEHIAKGLADWAAGHAEVLAVVGAVSAFMFIVTLAILPLVILAIPEDYFVKEQQSGWGFGLRHPLLRTLLVIGKNIIGIVLFMAGFIMLFIPGQGLLTILIAITLLNFPGKRNLELRLMKKPKIAKGVGWIRKKKGKKPIILP
jgi:hypothetical protein